MNRFWIVVSIAANCAAVEAQDIPPTYSAAGIVDSATFAAGALAPWSLATIFGIRLAYSSAAAAGAPREELADVRVFVNNIAAGLLFVSPTQINLLTPHVLIAGPATVRVDRQGRTGPDIPVEIAEAAPSLFRTDSGYVVAAHGDNTAIDASSPAKAGEIIVLYAAGLGRTKTWPPPLNAATEIVRKADLRVLLNGEPAPAGYVKYAGNAPGWTGLYQVNVELPESVAPDPELRIAVGERSSAAGARLAVR